LILSLCLYYYFYSLALRPNLSLAVWADQLEVEAQSSPMSKKGCNSALISPTAEASSNELVAHMEAKKPISLVANTPEVEAVLVQDCTSSSPKDRLAHNCEATCASYSREV
jgi:hypothetical protein